MDNVDIDAASEKNIPVCNTPEANMDSVAEHTIAFMFGLSKYLTIMDTAVRENNFAIRNNYMPVDLEDKVLGLVGFGKIGRKVAQICNKCFKMKIFYYDLFSVLLSFCKCVSIYQLLVFSIIWPYLCQSRHLAFY